MVTEPPCVAHGSWHPFSHSNVYATQGRLNPCQRNPTIFPWSARAGLMGRLPTATSYAHRSHRRLNLVPSSVPTLHLQFQIPDKSAQALLVLILLVKMPLLGDFGRWPVRLPWPLSRAWMFFSPNHAFCLRSTYASFLASLSPGTSPQRCYQHRYRMMVRHSFSSSFCWNYSFVWDPHRQHLLCAPKSCLIDQPSYWAQNLFSIVGYQFPTMVKSF